MEVGQDGSRTRWKSDKMEVGQDGSRKRWKSEKMEVGQDAFEQTGLAPKTLICGFAALF
jgi:hypothetical protein